MNTQTGVILDHQERGNKDPVFSGEDAIVAPSGEIGYIYGVSIVHSVNRNNIPTQRKWHLAILVTAATGITNARAVNWTSGKQYKTRPP